MKNSNTVRVLFCCMGNICRSPTAHGVFQSLVDKAGLSDLIQVDSAGTHAYHVGESPDPRSQQTARKHGVDLSDQRARQAVAEDFHKFDYVLAMDQDNYFNLQSICPSGREQKLYLFLDFTEEFDEQEVPDPYYGGGQGFERVFSLVQSASDGLLQHIKDNHM